MRHTGRHTPQSIHALLAARRRRNKQKYTSPVSIGRRGLFALGVLGWVLALAGVLAAGGSYLAAVKSLPNVETLAEELNPDLLVTPTRFYDRTGEVLLYEMGYPGAERSWLSLDPADPAHFSPQLVLAVTALEKNFWSGPGISFQHLSDPEPITMAEKIAAEFLLPQDLPADRQGTALRILAVQAQLKYGKAKILEWYLNTAYFGCMVYGAEQAAQVYLGKSATQVNLAESVLLLAALNSPSLNPLDAPLEAAEGAHQILDQLEATGQYSESDLEQARQTYVNINPTYRNEVEPDEFIRYTIHQAEDSVGKRRLERGGLRVITTLDADMQTQLLCTLRTHMRQIDPEGALEADPSDCPAEPILDTADGSGPVWSSYRPLLADSMLLDPTNGDILAWSGVLSTGAKGIEPDVQTGSLLTPFFAATAFSRGMSPASLVWDVPQPGQTTNLNPDGRWHGAQSLRAVVENGYLDAVYHTAKQVGTENVWMLASMLGLTGLEKSTLEQALAEGGGETSLLEVGQAFSTFAALGTQSGMLEGDGLLKPAALLRMEDAAGRVWFDHDRRTSRPILDEGLAYLVNDLLSGGDSAAALSPDQPAALAIRSAAGGRQAWAVGYTPAHVLVVWMGAPSSAPSGTPQSKNVDEDALVPAAFPAGVWKAVMQTAAGGETGTGWEMPENLVSVKVCQPSGQLPTGACPQTADELFLAGNEPAAYDTLYTTLPVNRQSGLLATVFTPPDLVEVQTFLDVPPEYEDWAMAQGIPQPPQAYDPLPVVAANPDVAIQSPEAVWYVHGQVEVTGTAAGEDFGAYQLDYGQGLYPREWIPLRDESLLSTSNAVLGVWDTTGLDGFYLLRLTVKRSGGQVDVAYARAVVDNVPPSVSIIWPAEQDTDFSSTDQSLLLLAQAIDPVGIASVQWFIDGALVSEQTLAPYYYSADLGTGWHVIRLSATDLAGNTAETGEIILTIE